MPAIVSSYCSALISLLLPRRCPVCRQALPAEGTAAFCVRCYADLPLLTEPFCTICGVPMAGVGTSHPCGRCITTPPPYSAARAALRFEGTARELLHALKYGGKTHLRRPLGLLAANLLAEFVADQQPDLLVPIPLHVSRLRSRGFNQSVLLGELLARQWGVPFMRQALRRIRQTAPQTDLSREQRLINLQGAFVVVTPAATSGRRIMLIDDVFTTGSTLAEAARCLLRAGCSGVSAVTVAHAP